MKDMQDFFSYMLDDETASTGLKSLQESTKARTGSSNLFYRYKRMPEGSSTTVRFLPISMDVVELEARPKFWTPKKVIRLRFENPEKEDSEVVLTIPVMQMYTGGKTEDDLILKQVKALYDEADALAKKGEEERAKEIRTKASYHWTRGECLAQGFVSRAGFQEDSPPENPIRLFELNKQIMNIIQSSVNSEDPETRLEYWPIHFKRGTNFVIKKTKSGEWPSYTQSCFSRVTSPLSEVQMDAIRTHGLFDLESFLPARPSDDEYGHLAHIVEASINGTKTWDPDWEADLVSVKVFKTNTTRDTDEEVDATRVREIVGQIGGTSATAEELVSKLNRTSRQTEEPDTSSSQETEVAALGDETGDPDDVPAVAQKGDTRSIIEKIKRGATKTATAAAD